MTAPFLSIAHAAPAPLGGVRELVAETNLAVTNVSSRRCSSGGITEPQEIVSLPGGDAAHAGGLDTEVRELRAGVKVGHPVQGAGDEGRLRVGVVRSRGHRPGRAGPAPGGTRRRHGLMSDLCVDSTPITATAGSSPRTATSTTTPRSRSTQGGVG
ncbi:MAG: hypothetical protein R2705_07465 [Ilumatobacteraceae bacterium]